MPIFNGHSKMTESQFCRPALLSWQYSQNICWNHHHVPSHIRRRILAHKWRSLRGHGGSWLLFSLL